MQPLQLPHDIKPIVDVPDNSFTLFVIVVVIVTALLLALLYFLYKWLRRSKAHDPKKEALKALQNIDLKQTKIAAYAITKHGYILADEPRKQEIYDALVKKLTPYKYKKEVPPTFDDQTVGYFNNFLSMVEKG
jgi:heme/copper-type cytochrome/quinol oxidase subunit 2